MSLGKLHQVKNRSRLNIFGTIHSTRVSIINKPNSILKFDLALRGNNFYSYAPPDFSFHIGKSVLSIKETKNPIEFNASAFQKVFEITRPDLIWNSETIKTIEGGEFEIAFSNGDTLYFYIWRFKIIKMSVVNNKIEEDTHANP